MAKNIARKGWWSASALVATARADELRWIIETRLYQPMAFHFRTQFVKKKNDGEFEKISLPQAADAGCLLSFRSHVCVSPHVFCKARL